MKRLFLIGGVLLWMTTSALAQQAPPPTVGALQRQLAYMEGSFKDCTVSFGFWSDQAAQAIKRVQELEAENKDLKAKLEPPKESGDKK